MTVRDPRFEDDDRDRVMDAEEHEVMRSMGIGWAECWFPMSLKVSPECATDRGEERNGPGRKGDAHSPSRPSLTEEKP